MKISNEMALMPIHNLTQPAVDLNRRGIDDFDNKKRPGDRIVYVGYHITQTSNTYGPSGNRTVLTRGVGEIVDIYI